MVHCFQSLTKPDGVFGRMNPEHITCKLHFPNLDPCYKIQVALETESIRIIVDKAIWEVAMRK